MGTTVRSVFQRFICANRNLYLGLRCLWSIFSAAGDRANLPRLGAIRISEEVKELYMKKLFALVFAAAVAVSMSAVAFAEGHHVKTAHRHHVRHHVKRHHTKA